MEIDVAAQAPDGATLVVPVTDPPGQLPEPAGGVQELLDSQDATADRGTARLVRLGERRAVVAGLGLRDELEPDAIRDAAAAAVRELSATGGGSAAWLVDESLPLSAETQARASVEGAILGSYDPGAHKTGSRPHPVERLTIVGNDALAPQAARAAVVAGWTNHARDLANAPASELTPVTFADRAAELAGRFDTLTAEALDPDEMERRGMGALLGVGQGSHNPPRLIVLRYEPAAPARAGIRLGLVGKGDHLRQRRHRAQAADLHGGDAGRHVRGGRRRCRHGGDRRARPARPRPHRRGRGRERHGRRQLPARRRAHGVEREDDRDHEHGRRGRGSCSPMRSCTRAARGRRTSSTWRR